MKTKKTPKKKPTKNPKIPIKLPLFEKLVKELSNKTNWQYKPGVEYDYDTSYYCDEGCDPYCRCWGSIHSTRIESVDINKIIKSLIGDYKEDIEGYCADRFIRHSDLKETDSWEVKTTSGYYGDEIEGCYPSANVVDKLLLDFKALIMLTNNADKIKDCLRNEYGHVLSELDKCNRVEIAEVPLDNIELFNQNHYRKLEKKYVDQYNDFKLPRAVCVNTGTKYRLIDGYHRMHAAANMKMDKVKILILS